MRAGTLRERITIQALAPTNDPEWGDTEQWQTVDTIPASVIARGGSEGMKDEGVSSVTTYDIETRYRSDLTSAARLIWNGKTLEVVSAIDPDGRRRSLKIEAKETT